MNKDRIDFVYSYINWRAGHFIYKKKGRPNKYAGKKLLSADDVNKIIYKKIISGQPFAVARYGDGELRTVSARVAQLLKIKKEMNLEHINCICTNSGFFPANEEMYQRFGDLMLKQSKLIDILALYYKENEEYMIRHYAPNAQLTRGRNIEPYYPNIATPWSSALKGKKVLIIHPFEQTIISQYKKREMLFPDTEVLPEFELKTLKAVQTLCGTKDERFSTWFDALDYMRSESRKIDFDIAIIGCGAYGFPLAAMLKEDGKQAIQMGGATQLLFGIKGRRWDKHPILSKLYNESWVRPSEDDTPEQAKTVENGCYW